MNAKSICEALNIIGKHTDLAKEWLSAEHDILYFPISLEVISEDSEDGKALISLGAHVDSESDSWACFV